MPFRPWLRPGARLSIPEWTRSNMTSDLSHADVQRLLSDPSADTRAAVATKIARNIDAELSDSERRLAEEIVRVMAQDASRTVREALSASVKTSKQLPHDVAVQLAKDIDEVALPILEFSEVLTDNDLIDIVRNTAEGKQQAIARRDGLSGSVSEALVDTDNPAVVEVLVGNTSAAISDSTLNRVVDRFGEMEAIQKPLVERASLPLTVAERLVARASDSLRDHLVAKHDLSANTATDLLLAARERATMGLADGIDDDDRLSSLVDQLAKGGRLSPSLILRSLCMGDTKFFEFALARLAGIPPMNAGLLIQDHGGLGFKSLYSKAKLPDGLFTAFHTAVVVAQETDFGGADYDRHRFARTMLERILTQSEGQETDDTEFLLRKLQDLAPSGDDAAT